MISQKYETENSSLRSIKDKISDTTIQWPKTISFDCDWASLFVHTQSSKYCIDYFMVESHIFDNTIDFVSFCLWILRKCVAVKWRFIHLGFMTIMYDCCFNIYLFAYDIIIDDNRFCKFCIYFCGCRKSYFVFAHYVKVK